ncbi:hypothetical protein Rhopal_005473-T1 [Rhodotorula paludigena]|uniref:Uncharacterized protein n=1 Tax=Rhodotorula paludigena TaxID=86838 RepID=A0AAV5GQI6_9BASI|nr:hypothetical protein Rhopal_005473-T1 [Rhodotorula paludigena]
MSSLTDTINRVLQKIHELATPHEYCTPQEGKKYTDRGRFRDVQIGPKVCAPTLETEAWTDAELLLKLVHLLYIIHRPAVAVALALVGRQNYCVSLLTLRYDLWVISLALATGRPAKVLLYHLLDRSLPTQKELNLDPVFQDSAAAVYAALLLGPDRSLVPGEVVLDHRADWIGVRFGRTLKALDRPLTALQLTQSQLSGQELDAKKWAMTTEYALTVLADLAAPSVLYKLLEKPSLPLPGWTSLNEILGGEGSGALLSAKLLEHIRALRRAEFKAELCAPGGMACTIAQGTERKRNIDPSHLILHPSRMAKYARLQDDGTINASSYSFRLCTGSAALALAKRPPSTTSTTVQAAARQKKADGLKIGFFFRSAAD